MTTDVRAELENALNRYFVALTLRADDGTETELPMCWITRVGKTRLDFKPSAVHHYTGTIAHVVSVKRTFPEGVEELEPEEVEGPSRPLPKTFGDWVDIAADIKEKDPNLASEVNENLGYIFTGDPAQTESSERWLVEKARELGIK